MAHVFPNTWALHQQLSTLWGRLYTFGCIPQSFEHASRKMLRYKKTTTHECLPISLSAYTNVSTHCPCHLCSVRRSHDADAKDAGIVWTRRMAAVLCTLLHLSSRHSHTCARWGFPHDCSPQSHNLKVLILESVPLLRSLPACWPNARRTLDAKYATVGRQNRILITYMLKQDQNTV
jgi:hypothetical protein